MRNLHTWNWRTELNMTFKVKSRQLVPSQLSSTYFILFLVVDCERECETREQNDFLSILSFASF